jgi:long-chain acyl-CoA synthetase
MAEHSTPALVEIPASANLTGVVFERAQRAPDTVVMRRRAPGAAAWRDVTAGEFRDEVTALAKGLIAAGIGAGDRVALMSRTRYEWTLADYAIWATGAVTVPIYETSSAEQVEWMLGDSGARALILETPEHEAATAEVLGRLPAVERVWLIEGTPAAPGAQPLGALAAEGAAVTDAQLEQHRTARGAGDLATVIYTSGTTGRPKGCQLTHGNLLADVRNVVSAIPEIFDTGDGSALLFLPLAHSYARIIQVGCLESGTVLGHTPDVARLLDDLRSFSPTFILAVPRVFEKVYNGAELQASGSKAKAAIFRAAAATAIAWSQALGRQGESAGPARAGLRLRLAHDLFDRLVYSKLRAATGGKVRYAVSGGGPLGERLGHFFRGTGITILEGYGLTETSAATTVNLPDGNKIGTVGLPLPGTTVRIADDGEILIKGPNVFAGYLHNEAATAETFADGWLLTGDMGELDDDGYLRVTGRKKELIVTAGGKNVAPAVLEDRLRANALISQCMVVGDGRPYIAVLVTLDEEALDAWKARRPKLAGASTAELIGNPELTAEIQRAVDEANKAVSRAESIRRFRVLPVDFTEENGYLTPSLKVKRSVVAKDFADDIDAIYAQPREPQPRPS